MERRRRYFIVLGWSCYRDRFSIQQKYRIRNAFFTLLGLFGGTSSCTWLTAAAAAAASSSEADAPACARAAQQATAQASVRRSGADFIVLSRSPIKMSEKLFCVYVFSRFTPTHAVGNSGEDGRSSYHK